METTPRKPIVAALLSLLVIGLGQFYNGELKKALILYGGMIFVLLGAAAAGIHYKFRGLLLGLLLPLLLLQLIAIIDAFRVARKQADFVSKSYNKGVVYILVFVIAQMNSFAAQEMLGLKTFKIPSGSLEPTLFAGDYIFADTDYYDDHAPRRGDLVVFKNHRDADRLYVKRVIGLQGDTLEIRNQVVLINNKPLLENYTRFARQMPLSNYRDFGPVVVPQNSYFVMGDNRNNSLDSRHWGCIARNTIIAKPVFVYWAKDKRRIGIGL